MRIPTRNLRIFIAIILMSLCITAHSQETKDIYQVVPFLKGKKWGLVYPDGTEFYPPVFDTIYMQKAHSFYYSVFGKEGEKERAIVEKGGSVMWLSPDKKLATVAKVERITNSEEKIERKKAAKEGVEPKEEVREQLSMPVETYQYSPVVPQEPQKVILVGLKGTPVEIRQTKDGYSFYRNGVHYPLLDAEKHYKRECRNRGRCKFVLLEKNGLQALVDLETLEFLVPYKYNRVQDHVWKDDWMTVVKDGLYGIVDLKGNELVPPKYQLVRRSVENKYRNGYFTTIVKNNDRFFFLNHKSPDLRESKVSYDNLYFSGNSYTKPTTAMYIAELNGKKGVVNSEDSIIVPIRYDSIGYTNDTRLFVIFTNKKVGFYNEETSLVKEPVYDQLIESYRWGSSDRGSDYYIMYVRRGDKTFFIDRYGKEFISK